MPSSLAGHSSALVRKRPFSLVDNASPPTPSRIPRPTGAFHYASITGTSAMPGDVTPVPSSGSLFNPEVSDYSSRGSSLRSLSPEREYTPSNDSAVCVTPRGVEYGGKDTLESDRGQLINTHALVSAQHFARDLTSTKRVIVAKNKFSWDGLHMLILALIRVEHGGPWKDTAVAFNNFLEADLQRQNKPDGLPSTTLRAQYREHERGKHAGWRAVNNALATGGHEIECLRWAVKNNLTSSVGLHVPSTPHRVTQRAQRVPAAPRKARAKAPQTPKINYIRKGLPITAEAVHPPLPVLLFRCYYVDYQNGDKSQGSNSSQGFVAGCFDNPHDAPPAPLFDDPRLLAEILIHLNKEKLPTALISTTDSFVNVVQRALNHSVRGKSCRISLINTFVLPTTHVFYASPFQCELQRQNAFSGINDRYKATNEYLVWAHIPQSAILHDLSVSDLVTYVQSDTSICSVLQLHLFPTKSWGESATSVFQRKRVYLTTPVIIALAEFLSFLGADIHTPPVFLARMLSEIIRGWAIQIDVRVFPAWVEYATIFAISLENRTHSGRTPAFYQRCTGLCEAFVRGVMIGLGEKNWCLGRKKELTLERALKRKGLVFPERNGIAEALERGGW